MNVSTLALKALCATAALAASSQAFAFLCANESVRCMDYSTNPGTEFTAYGADTCSSYHDYNQGSPGSPAVTVYYAYCSEHPCGGNVLSCTDYSTNPGRNYTYVNVDTCGDHGGAYCAAER